ncbi:alkaline phosphatase D family protein [Acidovorax sp.]|uniref:alkaline phosphatase D family protein n=1 Tax=Acidovorax sp. TaxID=1872122 RepID=UPI002FA09257
MPPSPPWWPRARPPPPQPGLIYRSFQFGDLVALHMLDTRAIGREEQLDYNNYITASGIDATGFTAAVGNPARQLLGSTQTQWLQQQMAASRATWQVLGQQVLMGRMNVPAPPCCSISTTPPRGCRCRNTRPSWPRPGLRPPR